MAPAGTRRAMFVSALATGSTVSEAAAAVGVSKRTAIRWHNQPDVQSKLAELRRATLGHARERLLGLVDVAADTLHAVMTNAQTEAARVAAARTVLAQVLRFDDAVDIEHRLNQLERATGAVSRQSQMADLFDELDELVSSGEASR